MHLSEQVISNKNEIKVLIAKIQELEKRLKEVAASTPDFYKPLEKESPKKDFGNAEPAN